MQFPIKVHYALLATLAMAEVHEADQLLTARTISKQQAVPSQFLGQILQQLRSSGIVVSVRGSSGGFKLGRHPSDLSVGDVIDAVCPPNASSLPSQSASPLAAAVESLWQELSALQRQAVESISLSDMLQRAENRAGMFYI